MAKPYKVQVFGKAGCDKCKTLNQRLDRLLQKPEWEQFEKEYCDVMTIDGLVPFCEAECINPQQIPAMLVLRHDDEAEEFGLIATPNPGRQDETCGNSRLYQYLGLQTDYTAAGVITPKMIASVLSEAQAVAPVPVAAEPEPPAAAEAAEAVVES